MNIWKADTRPSESLSLLEKGSVELPTCHLISRTSNLGLPLKKPVQNSKPMSGFSLLHGESGLVPVQIWESSHGITEKFRLEGMFRGYLVHTTAQTRASCKVRSGCSGVLPSQVLSNSMNIHYKISLCPSSSLTALAVQDFLLYVQLEFSLLQPVPEAAEDSNQISPSLAFFPLG